MEACWMKWRSSVGGKNFVATGDVAKGIVSALSHGKDGESYLLSGENLTYREFYRLEALWADAERCEF